MSAVESEQRESQSNDPPGDHESPNSDLLKHELDDLSLEAPDGCSNATGCNRRIAAYHAGRLLNQLSVQFHQLLFGFPVEESSIDSLLFRLESLSSALIDELPNPLSDITNDVLIRYKSLLCGQVAKESIAALVDRESYGDGLSFEEFRQQLFETWVDPLFAPLWSCIWESLTPAERCALELGTCLDASLCDSGRYRFLRLERYVERSYHPGNPSGPIGCESGIVFRLNINAASRYNLRALLDKVGFPAASLEEVMSKREQAEPHELVGSNSQFIERLDRSVREHLGLLQVNNDEPSDPISFDDIRVLAGKTKKRVQNCVSEWRKGDKKIPDPCSYAIARAFIIEQWPKKTMMFPVDYDAMLNTLAHRRADLPREK